MDSNIIKNSVLIDLKKDIPDLIQGIEDCTLKKLKSKKNIVYELNFDVKPNGFPQTVILKLFRTDYFEIENNALLKLEKQNVNVPQILYHKKPYLILKKLPGENLCDLINNKLINITSIETLTTEDRDIILLSLKKLAEWFAQLHNLNIIDDNDISKIIVLNKGDAQLRDFLYDVQTEMIYGLDFEESYEGNYLDDLAWICCSLLDTNPGIFELAEPKIKIDLINYFLNEYFKLNKKFKFVFSYFANRLIENLNLVIERRQLELSPIRKSVILKNISNGI